MTSRALIIFFMLSLSLFARAKDTIYVGSKKFTESYILAEMFSQLLEEQGYPVKRRFGMAGTLIAYEALKEGAIDVYPEYTGTISEVILKSPKASLVELKKKAKSLHMEILEPLGFNNTYAVVVRTSTHKKLGIEKISDLLRFPDIQGAVSYEFIDRRDGWKVLKSAYGLKNKVAGMELFLGYDALYNEDVDFSLAYSTDPMIEKRNFFVLEDDRSFFPKYEAVPFIQKALKSDVKSVLNKLSGKISNQEMIQLSMRAVDGESFASVAHHFLVKKGFLQEARSKELQSKRRWTSLIQRVKEHLSLTFLAVLLATLIALPLSILILRFHWLAQVVLGFAGLLQTIPSIALLTLMIPLFGIGFKPAIICLFLYSLLPILRNTYTGLKNIDPRLITAAKGIGLYPSEIFFSIQLPLSLPVILTGIRTATIISIGTATLAAFIGAGGLGEPIVTGLALNNSSLILEGAIPAALLAIITDFVFSGIEKVFVKTL